MKKMNSAALQQRGLIVKFQSFLKFALALMASVILASCGGGGAEVPASQSGSLTVNPPEGTFFAGVIGTITIQGGRLPYTLTSSEPAVLAVPATFNGHSLDVVPNNPGTVDASLATGALPIRTVNVFVRDALGATGTAQIHVAQNFLTGYGMRFTTTCQDGNACAGADTILTFDTVTNGVLHGNRPFRIEMVRGQCLLKDPAISGTTRLGTSVTTASDHEGKVLVTLSCPQGIQAQLDVVRLVDVGTGASTEFVLSVTGGATVDMSVVPPSLSFTGSDSAHCGTGTSDLFVLDGQAPYTAVSTNSAVSITSVDSPTSSSTAPAISRSNPGRFTISVNGCVDASVVVTDASGKHLTVSVKSQLGSADPPPSGISVTPNTLNLGCRQAGSVLVIGGTGTYSAASTDPNLSMVLSANTLTITRAGTGAAPPPGTPTVASSVNVTDGAGVSQVTVTNPATCP
jgi:hypothetical protein